MKRVVGLPGDVLEMRNERLFIGGKPVVYGAIPSELTLAVPERERRRSVFATEHLPGQSHAVMVITNVPALRNFGPTQVPAGNYFVMGDNRDDSFDSRYFGFVDRARIVGEAVGVAFSLQKERFFLPRGNRFLRSLDRDGGE